MNSTTLTERLSEVASVTRAQALLTALSGSALSLTSKQFTKAREGRIATWRELHALVEGQIDTLTSLAPTAKRAYRVKKSAPAVSVPPPSDAASAA